MKMLRSKSSVATVFALAVTALGALSLQDASAQDVAAGEKIFKKCKACHAVGVDAKNKIGPALNGVIGSTAGAVEDFKYSEAMTAAGTSGMVWTEETMDQFLTKPKDFMKGTKMSFPGLKKPEERAALIAYLKTFDAAGAQQAGTPAAAPTETAAAELPEPPTFTDEFLNDEGNIEAGKEHWFAQCTHCHGFKAYPGKAPKLKPHKYTPDFVYKRVTKGFKKMPGWEEVFTQEERMQITAYVKAKSFSP